MQMNRNHIEVTNPVAFDGGSFCTAELSILGCRSTHFFDRSIWYGSMPKCPNWFLSKRQSHIYNIYFQIFSDILADFPWFSSSWLFHPVSPILPSFSILHPGLHPGPGSQEQLTLNVLLSEPGAFQGGGTAFWPQSDGSPTEATRGVSRHVQTIWNPPKSRVIHLEWWKWMLNAS